MHLKLMKRKNIKFYWYFDNKILKNFIYKVHFQGYLCNHNNSCLPSENKNKNKEMREILAVFSEQFFEWNHQIDKKDFRVDNFVCDSCEKREKKNLLKYIFVWFITQCVVNPHWMHTHNHRWISTIIFQRIVVKLNEI